LFKLEELKKISLSSYWFEVYRKRENTLAYFAALLLMHELSELQKHTDIVQIRRVKEN
jgi:hypothetical protein